MTIPVLQNAVNAGEIGPSLFGRTDLEKYKKGTSTCRNMFASYRGGAQSRAGTAFVGQCKQAYSTGYTPQLIPFQYNITQGIVLEVGNQYIRFAENGAYITEAGTTITGVSNASPAQITDAGHGYVTGDWAYINGTGLNQLDGQTYLVGATTSNTFNLLRTLDGSNVDSTNYGTYVSGGTASRIYTLATPYQSADIYLLKWAQSADVLTLVHNNYPPADLARIANNNWTLTPTTFASAIASPGSCSATSSTSGTAWYQYVMTAVDATTGEESVPSPIAYLESDDISVHEGTITVTGAGVTGASSYNFYRAPLSYNGVPTGGALFGFVGTSFGPQFTDSNITPDYTTTPPLHANPFATSSVTSVNMTNGGTSYSATQTTVSISSSFGINFAGFPVIQSPSGAIQWVVINNPGSGYSTSDTVVFTDTSMSGSSATATLTIGPATGTYPGCVSYFQERRFYASTTNNPDTYYASQPGAFTNMDTSTPPVDSDAIIGSPWSQQVNGIQAMLNMPGGLVLLTGLGAWQLSGGGGGLAVTAAITPANQVAVPQAYNGCHQHILPIIINYDILYVQQKGAIVRDLSYNFFANIYTGSDLTVMSNHLFDGYQIQRWAWAEEPFKLIWAVRNDGILLCLTYLKEQDVYAWTRHDTNGLFQSVTTVSENQVNAPYFVAQRLIQNDGNPTWTYYLERMDDRFWPNIAEAWCVDAGLSYSQNTPNATLTVNSATGVATLNQPTVIYGGTSYSGTTYAVVVDKTGSGATVGLTIAGGVITAASVSGTLTGYTDSPAISVVDPTGAGGGAVINITTNNVATATTSPGVFANTSGNGMVGDVINAGNGSMVVTAYNSSTSVTVNIVRPITQTIQNDPLNTPVPFLPQQTQVEEPPWSIINPTSTVYGLWHLEGMTVAILADGVVVAPQVVAQGTITLPAAASEIVVGLGYTAQLQTLYVEVPGPATSQGRRKTVFNVLVRVQDTGGPFQLGANQPDASTQDGQANVPWTNMTPVDVPFGNNNPLQPIDFYTGDIYANVQDALGYDRGQIAIQQTNPIPLNILSIVGWHDVGDAPSAE